MRFRNLETSDIPELALSNSDPLRKRQKEKRRGKSNGGFLGSPNFSPTALGQFRSSPAPSVFIFTSVLIIVVVVVVVDGNFSFARQYSSLDRSFSQHVLNIPAFGITMAMKPSF